MAEQSTLRATTAIAQVQTHPIPSPLEKRCLLELKYQLNSKLCTASIAAIGRTN